MSINTFSGDRNQIMFLGTGGGRYVVFTQTRQSGGIWINTPNALCVIDPGPGALVHAVKHKIDPRRISCIFLSHRHLDHSADINTLIEAMTHGGKRKRGYVIAPIDALEHDPVILKYNRHNFNLIVAEEFRSHNFGDITVNIKCRHLHPVETYGAVFTVGNTNIAYISDTLYFEKLPELYAAETIIMNTVFKGRTPGFEHLCANDVYRFVEVFKPKNIILTHFGMGFLKEKPWEVAKTISKDTGVNVIAAYDNMVVDV